MKAWVKWVNAAVPVAGLALGIWWAAPPRPPVETWTPPSAQSAAATADRLALEVGNAWRAGHRERAWRAAQVLLDDFPQSVPARRLEPLRAHMQEQAQREQAAERWTYDELEAPGWGKVAQAQIEADPLHFRPDAPTSFLILRTGSQPGLSAVFLIPGPPLPATCQASSGCVIEVALDGASHTPMRLMPLAAHPGWWKFSDPGRMLDWAREKPEMTLTWEGQEEALRFPLEGLNQKKLVL